MFAFVLGLPYLWNYAAYAAVTSIATIGLYIAYVMPTFLRLRRGEAVPARPVAPGPLELPGRLDRRGLGRDHHDPVPAAAGGPDHLEDLQLRHLRRRRRRSASPGSTGWCRRASGSPARKVQGTAEELAAIEQELASLR